MTRRGITLLELVAALAVLSTFVLAAHAWTMSVVSMQNTLSDRDDAFIECVLAAIQDDLDGAHEIRAEDDKLILLTANAVPGDNPTDSGWHRVTWNLDRHRLVRTNEDDHAERVVLIGVEFLEVRELDRQPTQPLSLHITMKLESAKQSGHFYWGALE